MPSTEERTTGFFNKALETMAEEAREEYQNHELQKIVAHACANAPAIARKFKNAGIRPEDVKTVKDLEALPITPKSELSRLQQADPPFGGFLGLPLSEVKRICMSPGPIYEPEPVHNENDRWTQAFYAAGFRKGDIGQITFSYHLVPPAFWFEDALEQLGCVATPGGVGNTDLQVRMMRDLRVTGYIGTPSFLMNVAKKAAEMGYDLRKDLSLEVGFVAGEMLPESLRGELEEKFGMIVRQGYGTADVGCMGFECYHKNGMHFPYNCIVEIVDPDTGKQVGPGETGEIVTTVFDKAYPMIRFGTGDLSVYIDDPCPCGRTSRRLKGILGRVDQVTKVKGMFIHPSNADEVAAKFSEIDLHQVVVTRQNHEDRMVFRVVLKAGVEASEGLREKIAAAIPQCMRVRGTVEFIEKSMLPEGYSKIDDQRKWD